MRTAFVQMDFCEARLALQQAMSEAAHSYKAYRSGLIRFEVRAPFSTTACIRGLEHVQLACHAAVHDELLARSVHQASVRLRVYAQVPLPRSTDALRWLRGQPCMPTQLMPRVYFSPRHSSAPNTPGGAAASAAAAGLGAVAGVGSAWTWQVWQCALDFVIACLRVVQHLSTGRSS